MVEKKMHYPVKLILLIISIGLLLITFYLLNGRKKDQIVQEQNNIIKENLTNKNYPISMEDLNLLINKQNFDEAIDLLEDIYNNYPEVANIINYANVLANIGSITRKEKEYGEKAITIIQEAIQLDPNNSEAYRVMGYANEIMENYDNAFQNYNKSIELDDENAFAYTNRGHAYRLIGELDKALNDFLKSYKLNNKLDLTLLNLASSYLGQGDLHEALKFFNKVVNTSKNIRFKSEALFSIGSIQTNNGDYKKAEQSFRKAIEIDSNFELGYIGLSKVQFSLFLKQVKDNKEIANDSLIELAIKNLISAININPNKTVAYYQLALIYMDLGIYEQTDIFFKKALDTIPNDITLSKIEKEAMIEIINNQY